MKRPHGFLLLAFGIAVFLGCGQSSDPTTDFQSHWSTASDRTWVGPQMWANRLQDWHIKDRRLECVVASPQKPMRTVHLLSHRLSTGPGQVDLEVKTGPVGTNPQVSESAGSGFLVGAGPSLDYRAAALVHHNPGPGGGIFAGIDGLGRLFFKDFETNEWILHGEVDGRLSPDTLLRLKIHPDEDGSVYTLELSGQGADQDASQNTLILESIPAERLVGNIALVSHPGSEAPGASFWYADWRAAGSKLDVDKTRTGGPILTAQHTLSQEILKMTAQFLPLGPGDNREARLETNQGGSWVEVATAEIVPPAHTSTFRVENWKSYQEIPYRVVYDYLVSKGETRTYFYEGDCPQRSG